MAGNGAPVRNQNGSRVDSSDATSMHFKQAERSDGKKMSGKKMAFLYAGETGQCFVPGDVMTLARRFNGGKPDRMISPQSTPVWFSRNSSAKS